MATGQQVTGAKLGGQKAAGGVAAQYLIVVVGDTEMAVPLSHITEIVPFENVSRVPSTPDFLCGVVQLRGRVVPVLDLALRLGLPKHEFKKRACIIMLELPLGASVVPMGAVVDEISRLVDTTEMAFQPPPQFGCGMNVELLDGLLCRDGGTLPVISPTKLLNPVDVQGLARTFGDGSQGVPGGM